jgi:hypothetical protein
MSFGLLNLLMLFGLAAVAIPPLIHLLNRRRYNVVDWGAMQFLQISDAKRRRLLIEELLLMALRMGLIAIMVLALADPFGVSSWFSSLGMTENRDVVLVFGGSASMDVTGSHEAAKKWALELLDDLTPGDKIMILQAKQQVVPILAEPTSDMRLARKAIESLPPPGGGCDWPRAVQEAHRLLEKSQRPLRSIILLGNGQRHGWADEDSRGYWQALGDQLPANSPLKPRIWFLNFDAARKPDAPSWALAPLRARRVTAHVNQDIEFETDLLCYGQTAYEPPEWVVKEIDGERSLGAKLRFPSKAEFEKKRPTPLPLPAGPKEAKDQKKLAGAPKKQDVLVVPLPPFIHRFKAPGSHLVSVVARPKGARPIRQDYAVDILPLPVLIVDGDPEPAPNVRRRTHPLLKALDPRPDGSKEMVSAIMAQVVSAAKFEPGMLFQDIDKARPGTKPRVLVLANLPQLGAEQRKAVSQFLEAGGGVLVTLGDRLDDKEGVYRDSYNKYLYDDGKGWLPARLERAVKKDIDHAPSPLLTSFSHPALELFRQEAVGGLNDAYFRAWWQVTPAGGEDKAIVAARLNNPQNDPLLVYGTYKLGRVLLCTVPLMNSQDNKDLSWDTNLLRDLPSFAPLTHELVKYLAGNLSTAADKGNLQVQYNLQPGQPLHYGLDTNEADTRVTLAIPGGDPKPLVFEGPRRLDAHLARVQSGALGRTGKLVDFAGTQHTGAYVLRVPKKEDWLPAETADFFNDVFSTTRKVYYTVHSEDPAEQDLTPWTAEDRSEVARLVPLSYENDGADLRTSLDAQANTLELWQWVMAAVLILLCFEVWMTRRIVRAR